MGTLFAVLLSGVAQAPALANASATPPSDPSEIVVTGERVRQSLKETPSSVAVFSRKDIDAAAAADRIEELLAGIPNVQLGSGGDAPSIRGQDGTGVLRDLPGFLGGARPRATLQIDGRAVTYNEFAYGAAPLWDVDRVEVFRSPQSTTQGRNSIGGAIFITTADPSFETEASARLVAGNLDTRQFSAMVSAPLVDDQLAFRVTGDLYRSRTSSRLAGNIAGVDLNRDDYGTVRAKLLARPNAVPGLRLLLTYAHIESDMPQIESIIPPFKERRNPNLTSGYFSTNVDSLTAVATYRVSPDLESRTTVSWGEAAVRRFAPPGFGETRIRGADGSLESVLEWDASGNLRLVGGIHSQSARLHQKINLSAALLGEGIFKDRQDSTGLFGEIRWTLLPRLTLTGGARFQTDSQDRTGVLTGPAAAIPLDYHKRFHAFLPKLSLAYDVTRDLRVGLMAQRAYNPGGVTINLFTRSADRFDAEYLWDYELFARAGLLGNRLTIAANVFYNAIKDAQRQQREIFDSPAGPVFFSGISNAPAARSFGAEMEIGFRATRRISARAGVGLLSTRITKVQLDADPLLGKAFNRSPHFTGSAAVDWKPRDELRLSAQVRHHSPYFSDDANSPILKVESATTIDAKAAWQFRRFRLFGYARNLLDSFNLTYRFNPAVATAEDPREIGVGIEAAL